MKYKEISPSERLKPYVKCYFVLESDLDVTFTDTLFPGGHIEIVFNLGESVWRSAIDQVFQKDPPIELLGQITQPLAIRTKGKYTMLGIRFFAHTAAYFLNEEVWEFNNQISDLRDLLGNPIQTLHARLMDLPELNRRIELIEIFLVGRLHLTERKSTKLALIGQIVKEMEKNAFMDTVESIASRYDITPRYLQKLFIQHVGITPKVYSRINRFQRSLKHLKKQGESLTSTAYDCGYADQSHFIREFKSFTGITPSAYLPTDSSVNQAFSQ